MADLFPHTVRRIALSYDEPDDIQFTLTFEEGYGPSKAYLLLQAGLLYREWQQAVVVPEPVASTLIPPCRLR